MGNGNAKYSRPRSHVRLIPREPLQEKFKIPEVENDYPQPKNASTPKKDIYNPKDNRDIYFHALKAPKDIENSWDDLVDYLTSIYRTDMMKVRSIFSWLGVQEIESESFFFVPTPSCIDEITPRGYKKVIQQREGSYATLFAILCRKAGIRCAVINGLSKGFGYDVGDSEVSHLRDRWVAVYIDGWRLIHPLWAFKNIISFKTGKWGPKSEMEKIQIEDLSEETEHEVQHDFNEYYFLVEPSELIHVCFPDDERWQLITPKISKEKWINMPYLMKRYHMEGFKIAGEFKSTLKSKKGVCGLVVNAPTAKNNIEYQLAYDFFFNFTERKSDVDEAIHLNRYVLLSRDCSKKKWAIEARMPIAGVYRITVYGGPCTKTKLPLICDVAIKCKKSSKDIRPYPDCPRLGFGPVHMTETAGLTQPSHPNGMLFLKPRQTYHITFRLQQAVTVKARIIGEGVKEHEMDRWVTCTINNQSTLRILDVAVRLQDEGEYSLKIYSKPKDASMKAVWENVCNYYMSTDPPRENGVEVKDKGYKTATEVNTRKALEEASKGKDLFELKAVVSEFQELGLREEDGSFGKASLKMEYLELAKALKDAINRRNHDLLTKAIDQAEISDHAQKLGNLIAQAKQLRDNIAPTNKFMHAVLEMKQSTISELTSYPKPPEPVYDILKATAILLGEDPRDCARWEAIQAIFKRTGSGSILRRVRAFDIANVADDNMIEVGLIVAKYDESTMLSASAGAGTFYKWIQSVVEEKINGRG